MNRMKLIIVLPVMQQKHFISHPDQTGNPQSRILNYQKCKSSCIHVLCDVLFRLRSKNLKSSLHWDCIPFFVKCNQSDNQFTQIKPQNAEQNERSQIKEQKWPSLVLCSVDTETSPEAPEKTYRGGQIAVQKILISPSCKQN